MSELSLVLYVNAYTVVINYNNIEIPGRQNPHRRSHHEIKYLHLKNCDILLFNKNFIQHEFSLK